MKKALQRVIFSYVSIFSLLINMLQPMLYATLAPSRVLAQDEQEIESSPTPSPTESAIASEAPSAEPSASPSVEPSSEPSASPSPIASPEISPSPTPSPTESAIASEAPNTPTNTAAEPSPTPTPVAETPAPTIVPMTPVPLEPVANGTLNITVLEDTAASSINEFDLTINESGSATLVTDKADYAPTDTAIISGSGYEVGDTYLLAIWSDDEPATRTEVSVVADESGNIFYAYQLDGTYRPNYKAEVKDQLGRIIATTTFTDSREVVSVKVNNQNSVTVYPSASISVTVTVSTTGHQQENDWTATGYRIGSGNWACVNTPDNTSGENTYIESFNINAPSAVGTYDLEIRASNENGNSNSSCDTSHGDRNKTLRGAIIVRAIQHTPVTFCHATPPDTGANGYHKLTIDDDGIFQQGHSGQHGADIIPPFTYYAGSFAGKNWTTAGQAIYNNNCAVPLPPKLTVTKNVTNDNGGTLQPSDFELKVNGNKVNSGETKTYTAGQTYTISETPKSGYAQTSISCDSGKSNPVTLNNGDDVKCTVYNNDVPGTLLVKKVIVGSSVSPSSFSFNLNNTLFAFEADGENSYAINAGAYKVVEVPNDLFTTTYNNCDSTISLGETKTCTITNTRKTGNLFIDKILVGGGPALDSNWSFVVKTLGGSILGTLNDSTGNNYINGLATGSYTITETGNIPGYSLTGVGNACKNLVGSTATATVNVGNNVCEFTNTRDTGSVRVNKQVDLNGDGDFFDHDEQSNNKAKQIGFKWTAGNGNVDMGSSQNLPTTITGVVDYSVSETSVAGYHYVGWFKTNEHRRSCTNLNGAQYPVPVVVEKGRTTEITLCNARDMGTITIVKDAKPDSHDDFFFTGDLGNFTLEDDGDRRHSSNSRTFSVPVGTYNVTERGVNGWYVSNITCNDQNSEPSVWQSLASISLEKGEHVTCTFENTKYGRIEGYKYHDENGNGEWNHSEGAIRGWDITLSGNDLTDSDRTDHHGYYSFSNLKPGTYTICEEERDGWFSKNNLCRVTTITAGDTDRIDFGNYQKSTITIKKDVVKADGSSVVDTSTGFTFRFSGSEEEFVLYDQDGSASNYKTFVVDPGSYSVTEDANSNYDFAGCRVLGEHDHHHDDWCSRSKNNRKSDRLNLRSGESITLMCTNKQKTGDLNVIKFNDLNGDGEYNKEREQLLSGWEMQVVGQDRSLTQVTGEGGNTLFKSLILGWYDLSENMTEDQLTSWKQTGVVCDKQREQDYRKEYEESSNGFSVYVTPATTTTCYVGNQQKPVLTLSKSNNATSDKAPGDSVVYTLVARLTGSDLEHVVLTDLPPHGFKYRAGSYVASSHVTEEPTYASPGRWTLGNMQVGDEVTMSYTVDIDASTDAGKYPDLAWIQGNSIGGWETVYGNSGSSPSIFVGTSVAIVKNEVSGTNVKVEREGEVLGASTELPATGADVRYIILASALALLGFVLTFGKKSMKKIFSLAVFVSLLTFGASNAMAYDDPSLAVRLEEPHSPTKIQNQKFGFTVLDTDNVGVTVRCFVKKPASDSFVQFGGDQALIAGGNSGNCTTDSSVIGTKGNYEFYVTANDGSGDEESNRVSLSFDNESPSTPTYSKDHPSSCRYVIKFHTSSDNQTRKVEIYRSLDKTFNADDSTRVGTVNIDPDKDGEFVHDFASDCDKEWFYAIRAFDEAGNGSNVVGDTITINTTSSTTTVPAIPVAGSVLGKKTAAPSPSPESGEVLGQVDQKDATVSGEGLIPSLKSAVSEIAKGNSKWWLIVVIAFAASGIYTLYYVAKNKNKK